MGLWTRLTGNQTTPAPATGRTLRDRARRNREIRAIDANTSRWLQNGGLTGRKERR